MFLKMDIATKTDQDGDAAEEILEQPRKCLMCAKDFLSSWAGNRICKKCRSSTAYRRA
jgi:hypothetical protein